MGWGIDEYIQFFKWDGSEPFAFDKDKLMDELSKRLMADGNLSEALWRMQNSRLRDANNQATAFLEGNAAPLERKKAESTEPLQPGFDHGRYQKSPGGGLKDRKRRNSEKSGMKCEQKAGQGSGDLAPETIQKIVQSMKDKATQKPGKTG